MSVPAYDHIVIVMMENHDYGEIIGNTNAPYINSLAAGGALLSNYTALSHPSEPNYLGLYAGSTFGVTDDNFHNEPDPTLDTILQTAGKTFAGYVEHPNASSDHNPWESFPEGVTVERDFSTFPFGNYASLPNVSFVIPSLDDDMHNGTIQQGDTWLKTNLDSYAQWAKANNSLLIVQWDEGDASPTNQVASILYGAHVVPGNYNAVYNHYNMLSTILAAFNLTGPNNAATASPIQVFAAGKIISSSTTGPVVLGTGDNPVTITSAGAVSATGSGVDGIDGPATASWTIANDGTVASGGGSGIVLRGGGIISNGASSGTAAYIHGANCGITVYGGTGTVTNAGTISGAGDGGVVLFAGSVTNAAGAAITGFRRGIGIYSGGTVVNSGSIGGSVGIGGGGGITNNVGAAISGGVGISGAPGTIVNRGTITNPGTLANGYYSGAGMGVVLSFAGSVSNATGGVISGKFGGVYLETGTVSNTGSITGLASSATGVVVAGGGSVTNSAGGVISGGGNGVYVKNAAAGTVTNAGTITGAASDGVALAAGGTIGNAAGGVISGNAHGVFVLGAAGTVTNSGTISGATYDGIILGAGGSITNNIGASIAGGTGIYVKYRAAGTVTNAGRITGTASDGLVLAAGGSINNVAGGVISGAADGVFVLGGPGTIANNGMISGGSTSGYGLVLASGGGITNAGSISGRDGLGLRAGGSVTNAVAGSISGVGASGTGVFIAGVPGTLSNAGRITGNRFGLLFVAGGSITNAASASISGSVAGIFLNGGNGILTNNGSISATAPDGAGLDIEGGGSISNNAGASISGSGFGIFLFGAGTITNAGSIAGYRGIDLAGGGSVTNAAGASISGNVAGVFSGGGTATITNSGTISATGAAALDIEGGGSITNNAGASISGSAFGVFMSGGGTITNAGTMSGGTYAVDFASSAANRLVVNPGAVFNGAVGGGGGTLELASGTGAVGGIGTGTFYNFQALAVDAGGTWTLNGANTAPSVLDNGTLAIAGSLVVSSAVDPSSTGLFQLGSGATFDVAADVGTQSRMSFLASSELLIDNAATFGANVGTSSYTGPQLQNFVSGDTIDLKSFGSAGVTLNYDASTGVLQVASGSSQLASLDFQNSSLGSGAFHAATDGATGILITHS
jgi:hypothetical protein